jgi:hypothetical protein
MLLLIARYLFLIALVAVAVAHVLMARTGE